MLLKAFGMLNVLTPKSLEDDSILLELNIPQKVGCLTVHIPIDPTPRTKSNAVRNGRPTCLLVIPLVSNG